LNANCKIVDKKEILQVHTVSNTSIYCSSDELVQFTINVRKFVDSHASDSGAAGWEGRIIMGAQAKPLYSQMALSRKPFGIGHVHIKFFA